MCDYHHQNTFQRKKSCTYDNGLEGSTKGPQQIRQSHLLTFVCGSEEEGGYDSNSISAYGCCVSCLETREWKATRAVSAL